MAKEKVAKKEKTADSTGSDRSGDDYVSDDDVSDDNDDSPISFGVITLGLCVAVSLIVGFATGLSFNRSGEAEAPSQQTMTLVAQSVDAERIQFGTFEATEIDATDLNLTVPLDPQKPHVEKPHVEKPRPEKPGPVRPRPEKPRDD